MTNFSNISLIITAAFLSVIDFCGSFKTAERILPPPAEEVISTIKISAVGDLMCHSVQYNYAQVSSDSFNFNPVYREIKNYIESADFAFANLETVTAGAADGYSGYPFFNSPDDFIASLKYAGFDLLTTANNHSLDRGPKGLMRTIEVVKSYGLNYNGTFVSKRDRDSSRIYNINGIKVGMLAYTYGTNGMPVPKGREYIINLIDSNLIVKDIKQLRKKGAELVLVHYHFGEEYKREPVNSQLIAVETAVKAGADLIIGGHPHVIQPSRFFKTNNATLDSGFTAYSLGNFVSNQRWRYSDAGVILNIYISKNINKDSVYISGVTYTPTYVFKGTTEKGREYIILPSALAFEDSVPGYLSGSELMYMRQAFNDTKEIMTRYGAKIKTE